MAALKNISMVIGAAVAALGSVLFIAWSRYFPIRRRRHLHCTQYKEEVKYLDKQILVLGLDGAGKSSIIHALSTNTVRSSSAPTHGFNSAQILYQGMRIELLEVGGSQNLRTYWNQYLKNANIMVYVVDSTDNKRLRLARDELHRLMDKAPQLPLMVLANKQDQNTALDVSEIHSEMSLHQIAGQREVTLLGTSALADGVGQSTKLWTVRSLLEERLHRNRGLAHNVVSCLQTTHCQNSMERDS